MVVKFTRDGKHLLTIGRPGVVGSDADTAHLNRPSNVAVDTAAGEVFVADGYGNHRTASLPRASCVTVRCRSSCDRGETGPGVPAAAYPGPVSPAAHARIEGFLRSRFAAALHSTELQSDTALFSSGLIDSFGVLELMAFIEQAFGVDIDPTRHELADFDTIDRIVALIEKLERR
jgi:acyl carrier protein